ncbi:F-box/kelch-repeat protein SKIP25-like [Durio zibethinus]|uniref:F-box/kelch-repeat protein SKIP25-like n=1 Tax=Durio zibethinus TaxID=66656 RepID=A0A6P5Z4C9_DURZI|nr:F-box/kelch-repeat protein SKIP25-like [Durio zibethinus]
METTPQCSKQTKNDSLDETVGETLLPGLPDDLAQRCLSSLSPSLLFSVCHPWRRLLYSPSFPPFFSLYALLSPLQNPTTRNLGEVASQNSIEFFSFDPLSSAWRPLPRPPQNPPLHLLHRHPSFLSRNLPIQSLAVSNHLVLIAATTHKLFPALSSPLVFHPESNRWFYGPQVSIPRRWCATGSARGVVYIASGVGSHYKPDVARSMEQWDLNKKIEKWCWENKAQLKDGRFSREAVEAVGYRGKLYMVNVKGNAVKEGAVYNVELDKWEDMPPGMVAGWTGPAATMDEDVIYVIDEVKGCLSKYDGEKDCWVKVIELEQLKRVEQIAAGRGKICAVSANGESIIVVDVGGRAARFWEVAPPRGLEVVAAHVLPRISRQE